MFGKLGVVAALMFGFGYALVPVYRAVCTELGINVLSLAERQVPGNQSRAAGQHAGRPEPHRHGRVRRQCPRPLGIPSGPAQRRRAPRRADHGDVRVPQLADPHDGGAGDPELCPKQAEPYFNKLECFCFNQYTMKPGESKQWPVVFVIDPKLPKDVRTITLSYTFFEVNGGIPPEPAATLAPPLATPEAKS